eukprot:scaffold32486_cov66-Cyclotella_meneghiniana.AAC.8
MVPTAYDDDDEDESTTESPTYYPTFLNATEFPTSNEVEGWENHDPGGGTFWTKAPDDMDLHE